MQFRQLSKQAVLDRIPDRLFVNKFRVQFAKDQELIFDCPPMLKSEPVLISEYRLSPCPDFTFVKIKLRLLQLLTLSRFLQSLFLFLLTSDSLLLKSSCNACIFLSFLLLALLLKLNP